MKSRAEKTFLHSHSNRYPLRYQDERVSSQGQQVTGYAHSDANNLWIIEPVTGSLESPHGTPKEEYVPTKEEEERSVRYVRNGDTVRLLHAMTKSYLLTHDVASPLTTTNMEVTTFAKHPNETRYKDTLWRIEVKAGSKPGSKLRSKRDLVRVINARHNVALCTNKKKLPKWGFDQREINGNKNLKEDVSTIWFVDTVEHSRISNGLHA